MHASRMGRVGDRWRCFGVADDIDIDDLPMENKKIWQQMIATIGAAWLDIIAQGDSNGRKYLKREKGCQLFHSPKFKSSILAACAMVNRRLRG